MIEGERKGGGEREREKGREREREMEMERYLPQREERGRENQSMDKISSFLPLLVLKSNTLTHL